jgi:hypothetical protein
MGKLFGQEGNQRSIFAFDSMEQLIAGIRTKGKLEPIKIWFTGENFQINRLSKPQVIQRTGNPVSALLKHVSVNHRGGNILVSQQGLNGSDIGVSLKQVSCKSVAKGMGGDSFLEA